MSILYSRSYHIHIAQVLYRRIDQLREFLGEQDAATQRRLQGQEKVTGSREGYTDSDYGVRSLIFNLGIKIKDLTPGY